MAAYRVPSIPWPVKWILADSLAVRNGIARLPRMLRYPAFGLILVAILPSCGLVKVPFKVAGAVVEGTAHVGKKAYDASADAFADSEEEKQEKAKKEKEKEAKKRAEEAEARKKEVDAHSADTKAAKEAATPPAEDFLPPLPENNQPLPDDNTVPYQDP